ncbi:MAG TPA: hemerythrin domain-containing protein [Desulfosalsimonadaceae bacterium]|nr:hemerythrin domain-containing protein [Desulfosalsimonadaceae bacterium]
MQARGPLMIEHRLIERLIGRINKELRQIEANNRTDPFLIDIFVDFIKTCADRTHHGKEEDIFFAKLSEKSLLDNDSRIMEELIEEHKFGRNITAELVDANARYLHGDPGALSEIAARLHTLAEFYPKHIEKEDAIFFPAARQYLSDAEEQAMLEAFWDFDRKMIHEKYEAVARELENPDRKPG